MYRTAFPIVLSCFLLVGCQDLAGLFDANSPDCTIVEPAPIESNSSTPTALEKVADRVEGFGGYFYEGPSGQAANRYSQGTLSVYLLDPNREAGKEAQAAIADVFDDGLAKADLKVLRGQYTYTQLSKWYSRASNILSLSGVTLTELQERENRLRYGVKNERARTCVKQNLESLDIPLGAVIIEKVEVWSGPA